MTSRRSFLSALSALFAAPLLPWRTKKTDAWVTPVGYTIRSWYVTPSSPGSKPFMREEWDGQRWNRTDLRDGTQWK